MAVDLIECIRNVITPEHILELQQYVRDNAARDSAEWSREFGELYTSQP